MRTIRLAIAWAALSGSLPAIALAQEPSRPAELQRLGFYVGSWSESGQMRDDPAKPFQPIRPNPGGGSRYWRSPVGHREHRVRGAQVTIRRE